MRTEGSDIEVLFKALGDGLRLLAAKNLGDTVSVLGPIGQPFSVSPERPNCVLIGGGVGIPPMVFLADRLRLDDTCKPVAILGSEIPFPFDLRPSTLAAPWAGDDTNSCIPLLENWGIPSRLCSLGDFPGTYRGYVTDLADLYLQSLGKDERAKTKIYTCGPTVMLKAVADLAARYDVPCEVSLEEFMACAVGGCAGCTVEISTPDGPAMQRVCVDGPVFDAKVVNW
jgi:dihydroorotate dehydrogenase electron transfer subunit